MRKIFYTTAFLLILIFSAQAQRNHVRNLKVEPNEEWITFTFDIIEEAPGQMFNICLKSYDSKITPYDTKGIIGEQQSAGINLKIIWNYANDGYAQNEIDLSKLDIVAIQAIVLPPAPPEVSTYVGLVGAAAGLGAVVFGTTAFFKVEDKYEDYKNYAYPSDITLSQRDEYFQDLNSDYKTAQALMYGGGVVAAASVWLIIKRRKTLARRKKIERAQELKTQCNVEPFFKKWEPIASKNGVGVAFAF